MEDFQYKAEWLEGINQIKDLNSYEIFRLVYDMLSRMKKTSDDTFTELEINLPKDTKVKVLQSTHLLLRFLVTKKNKIEEKAITKFLNENTLLDENQIQQFVSGFNAHNDLNAQNILSLGKLLSFNWNIKNISSSKNLDEINRMFVELDFKVQKSDLTIENHSVSLSLPEFKKFSQQVKEMRNSVETFS